MQHNESKSLNFLFEVRCCRVALFFVLPTKNKDAIRFYQFQEIYPKVNVTAKQCEYTRVVNEIINPNFDGDCSRFWDSDYPIRINN